MKREPRPNGARPRESTKPYAPPEEPGKRGSPAHRSAGTQSQNTGSNASSKGPSQSHWTKDGRRDAPHQQTPDNQPGADSEAQGAKTNPQRRQNTGTSLSFLTGQPPDKKTVKCWRSQAGTAGSCRWFGKVHTLLSFFGWYTETTEREQIGKTPKGAPTGCVAPDGAPDTAHDARSKDGQEGR